MQIGSSGSGEVSNNFQAKLVNGANDQQEEVVSKLLESTEEVSEASRDAFGTGQSLNIKA